jgi:hypothetical protein
MLRAIANWAMRWAVRYAATPERQAEKALSELRMELFRAELRVLDTQMHAEYYRARLNFVDEVARKGIEPVVDQRRGQQDGSQALRTGHKLTAA